MESSDYEEIVKSIQVSVKEEIIDTDYSAAVGDCNISINREINLLDSHNDNKIEVIDKAVDKLEEESEFDIKILAEHVKLEVQTVEKENQSDKEILSEIGNEIVDCIEEVNFELTTVEDTGVKQESTVIKCEAVSPITGAKSETLEPNAGVNSETLEPNAGVNSETLEPNAGVKYEGLPASAGANATLTFYNTEENAETKKGIQNDHLEDDEAYVLLERCGVTTKNKYVEQNADLCKIEKSGVSNETVHNTEENQSLFEKKGYTCEICKKSFIKKSSLSSHEMTHTGETPFKCQFCNKGFNVRSNLNVHLRIHTGQRPHICEICQKTFRQAGQLKSHERIHKGEKPYICSMCKRSFRNSSALITHQRTHTGERPFPCDLCSRSFSTSTSLKTHRITHSGTMLYDCPVCGRQFNRKNNLNVHIKRHNKNRKFSCPKCSNGFVMRAHLLGHLKRAHKIDIHSEQVNAFLDSWEESLGGTIIKNEQELEIKHKEEFDNKNANNIGGEYHCARNKHEFGSEGMEVKRDKDDG